MIKFKIPNLFNVGIKAKASSALSGHKLLFVF